MSTKTKKNKQEIIEATPTAIVEPTAKRLPSPAPGPMLPISNGNIAIIVEREVIIIALNLRLQASRAAL